MIAFFMGFELLQEEKMAMEGYLDAFGSNKSPDRFVSGYMSRAIFEQLFIIEPSLMNQRASVPEAKVTIKKVKTAMNLKQFSLVTELQATYMSPQEKVHKEVNNRSLKHLLFKLASLQTYEMDNLVMWLDREQDGFVKITEIQTAML